MKTFPELTYIPLEYANSSVAHLRVFTKNNKKLQPQIKESFFILWLPLNLSEETLSKSIKKVLPDFP
ncbi:MAG: hypothetical protein EU530_10615, partial [Promethearchaeota archaeon]